MNAALQRIVETLGIPDIVALLGEKLAPTDLQSLMLAVYARQAAGRAPGDVLGDYERGRFFGASPLPWSGFAEWAVLAERAAPDFEFLTLSPMTPLASCASVASVQQDWSVATARSGEVVSDPTNVLALEAALRRRKAPAAAPLHLATVQRVVRPQAYGDGKRLAHFSLFALLSAGRDTGSHRLEAEMIGLHIDALIGTIRRFMASPLPLSLSYTIRTQSLADARLEAIAAAAARHGVPVQEDRERTAADGYYAGCCFHLWAEAENERLKLADGGTVDWVGKLASNRKQRSFVSGCGVDRLIALRQQLADTAE